MTKLSSFLSLVFLCACSGAASTSSSGGEPAIDGGSADAALDAPTATDAAPPRKGDFTFTIDGVRYVAQGIRVTRDGEMVDVTGTYNDGHFDHAVRVVYDRSETGSSACGSMLSLSRQVWYTRSFAFQGQTATDATFLSGLEPAGGASRCTFSVQSSTPAAGTAKGTLFDTKALIGGGAAVKPPIEVDVRWADVP